MTIAALDIETAPARGCEGIEAAGLVPHLSRITVIGVVDEKGRRLVFREDQNGTSAAVQLMAHAIAIGWKFVGHNLKFDIRHILHHEPGLRADLVKRWLNDTMLMAHNFPDKVVDQWLAGYEAKRNEISEVEGIEHRKAGPLSLKVLAPYFLGVEPFWETPNDHDNDEYVLKDCEYTLKLYQYFKKRFEAEFPEAERFNLECQLPWTKMLLDAELKGIAIDTAKLSTMKYEATAEMGESKLELDGLWQKHYDDFAAVQLEEHILKYDALRITARSRIKEPTPQKLEKVDQRYKALEEAGRKSLEPFNLASPQQLSWLLKDKLGYDIQNFSGKESTGKEVLQRLADEGKEDAKLFLKWRKASKLVHAYFPRYEELITRPQGRIHSQFNPAGARTGRLSSSLVNIQQVPPVLREAFIADKDHVLVTRDLSALEPVLIAYFSADPMLMKIVQSGMSFHDVNAQAVFQLPCELDEVKSKFPLERKVAKEFGLSVLYGAGAKRVQTSFLKHGVHRTEAECKHYVKRLRETYAGVWAFKQELDRMLERGEIIYNYMGRPIIFHSPDEVYMKGFNRLIQGSGSDILQQAAFDIANDPVCPMRPLLLVHDELVVQVPEKYAELGSKQVVHHMTKWPLDNELGSVRLSVEGKTTTYWSK